MPKERLVQFTDSGFYVPQANAYIDPWKPVNKAIITHAHADHSRPGSQQYICTPMTEPVLRYRLQTQASTSYSYGETFFINGVQFCVHPAGHIIGSAQVRIEYKGEIWVLSGDYKTQADGFIPAFEPIKCHHFVTESTFGLPVFSWKTNDVLSEEINNWWSANQAENKPSLLLGYSLGKAQRLLKYLDTDIGKIFTHGAIENMTEVIRPMVNFPETTRITRETKKEELIGNIVLAPPSAHGSTWIRKMVPYITASASGWMAFRGARRRRAVDRGFVMSDHCDWQELLVAIKATEAEKIICTHGYTDIFSKYLREQGYDARTESTQFEGELSESDTKEESEVII